MGPSVERVLIALLLCISCASFFLPLFSSFAGSFEHFVELATGHPSTGLSPHADLSSHACLFTTAILEAARRSLDADNRKVHIRYDQERRPVRLE